MDSGRPEVKGLALQVLTLIEFTTTLIYGQNGIPYLVLRKVLILDGARRDVQVLVAHLPKLESTSAMIAIKLLTSHRSFSM